MTYSARLTGPIHVSIDGGSCAALRGKRSRSILGYLLLHKGDAIRRDTLAGKLWPDQSEEQARTNLRRELHTIRQKTPAWDPLISGDRQLITLDKSGSTDVQQFYSLRQHARAAISQEELVDKGVQAFEHLSGDLLSDFDDEWVLQPRATLQSAAIELAGTLLPSLEGTQQFESAIRIAETLVGYNPYSERSYEMLMRAYMASGDLAMALHTYQRCESELRQELDVPPGDALQMLYRELGAKLPSRVAPQRPMIANVVQLVGRDKEISLISGIIDASEPGPPAFLFISGEAGIGKTALLEHVSRDLVSVGSESVQIAFAPEALAHSGLEAVVSGLSCRKNIGHLPIAFQHELHVSLPNVFPDAPEEAAEPGDSINRSRPRLFEAVTRLLSTSGNPLVILIDDIQWIDNDTADWLLFLSRKSITVPVTIVAAARTEDTWDNPRLASMVSMLSKRETLIRVPVAPLNPQEITNLLEHRNADELAVDRRALLSDRVQALSSGNPFFAIEYLNFLKRAVAPAANEGLTENLDQMTADRLGSLSEGAIEVLSTGALLDQPFAPMTLQHIGGLENAEFTARLEELWQRGIIATRDGGKYGFRHELLRESIVRHISPPRRQHLHGIIASGLVEKLDESGFGNREQIARHFEASGNPQSALKWYREAADIAERSLAHRKVVLLCDRALGVLPHIDDDENLVNEEINLLLLKARQISLLEGFTAPKVGEIYEAVSKKEELVSDPKLRHAIAKQFRFFLSFGERPRKAIGLANDQIHYAQKIGSPMVVVESWRCRGITEYQLGRFEQCESSMNNALEIVEREHEAGNITYDNAPFFVPVTYNFQGLAQVIQNRPHESLQSLNEANTYRSDYSAAFATLVMTMSQANVFQLVGDVDKVEQLSERLEQFSERHYLPKLKCFSDFLKGWVIAQRGDPEQALALFKGSQERYPPNADHHMFPTWWTHRAAVEMDLGQVEDALNSVHESIGAARRTRQGTWLAEQYRHLGIALHRSSADQAEVEAAFDLSVKVARRQNALLFEARTKETRTAISLS